MFNVVIGKLLFSQLITIILIMALSCHLESASTDQENKMRKHMNEIGVKFHQGRPWCGAGRATPQGPASLGAHRICRYTAQQETGQKTRKNDRKKERPWKAQLAC